MRFYYCLILTFLALAVPLTASHAKAEEMRIPVKVEGKKVLPLRVLTKPFSNVYQEKSKKSSIVIENVPAFQPFYVYTRPAPQELQTENGWYEVGLDNRGKISGWIKANDVFEWKQTLCLSYTHPLGRKPVLMFDQLDYLDSLTTQNQEQRTVQVNQLYDTISTGNIPASFPVKSIEPKKAIDISKEFYLLPILDYRSVEIDNREGRLVQLAAVTNASPDARDSSDIRINKQYTEAANQDIATLPQDVASKVKMDVVWVIDTTVSMRPFIERTLEVVKKVSQKITGNSIVNGAINFGIWGYRDSVKDIPGIDYTTNNYTPALQGVNTFIQTLEGVQVTQVDSVDYAEDMFSGVHDAITQTAWTPEAIRFIILVGDAPSHPIGHKWNMSNMEENTLAKIAQDRQIFISGIHIKNPKAKKYHELTEEQISTLAAIPGTQASAYMSVDSTNLDEFSRVSESISATISGVLTSILEKAQPAMPESPATVVSNPQANTIAPNSNATQTVSSQQTQNVNTKSVSLNDQSPAPQQVVTGELAELKDTNTKNIQTKETEEKPQGELAELENGNAATASPSDSQNTILPSDSKQEKVGELAGLENSSLPPTQDTKASEGEQDKPGHEKQTLPNETVDQQSVETITLDLDKLTESNSKGNSLAAQVVKAALVQWIGSQTSAKAPREISAWALDKDLLDPSVQSLEVRFLINKRQLDSLYTTLISVYSAGQQGQIGGEAFFDALKATAATAVRDPNLISKAKSLAATGLIPEFLEGLPYTSQLMDMTNELWASWSVDEQDEFLNNLEADMEAYTTIHDSPEGWIKLNPGDDPDEAVYPISLDLLP